MLPISFIINPSILRAFRVDSVVSEEKRIIILRILYLCIIVIGAFLFVDYAVLNFAPDNILAPIAVYLAYVPVLKLFGVLIILSALFCCCALVEFYYRVLCVEDALFVCDNTEYRASVETFRLLARTDIFKKQKFMTGDLLHAMDETLIGRALAFRLGVNTEEMFRSISVAIIDPKNLFEAILKNREKTDTSVIRLAELLDSIRALDTNFSDLLFRLKTKPEVLRGATDWVEDELININKSFGMNKKKNPSSKI